MRPGINQHMLSLQRPSYQLKCDMAVHPRHVALHPSQIVPKMHAVPQTPTHSCNFMLSFPNTAASKCWPEECASAGALLCLPTLHPKQQTPPRDYTQARTPMHATSHLNHCSPHPTTPHPTLPPTCCEFSTACCPSPVCSPCVAGSRTSPAHQHAPSQACSALQAQAATFSNIQQQLSTW